MRLGRVGRKMCIYVHIHPYIPREHAFPNQMTYLSHSVQVYHSTVVGPSTNEVISILPGRRPLGGKQVEGKGKVGQWARAEGHINKS